MLFLASINAFGNFIGMTMNVKYGRRELILKCCIPMGISLIILALTMVMNIALEGFSCKIIHIQSIFLLLQMVDGYAL
jgi:hypothetical protein